MDKPIQHEHVEIIRRVYLDGKYAAALVSATDTFKKTNQNINNFQIYIEEEADDVIAIIFAPKFIPGERVLGGGNSHGKEIHYVVNIKTGEIVKTSFAR